MLEPSRRVARLALALAVFAAACGAPVAQSSAEAGAERPDPARATPEPAAEHTHGAAPDRADEGGSSAPAPSTPAPSGASSTPAPSGAARSPAAERASDPSAPRARGVIDVDVGKLKNASGRLACRLYDSATGFPMEPRGGRERVVKVTGEVTRCSFQGVPPGTYAVTVVHDENANGELDTTFYGAPSEGYGVSNDRTRTFGAPRWDECKFDFDGGALRLRISLVY